jgi:alpha-N-arabinofuranosidase
VFSSITGNEIHDIHVRQLFTGAEMAGIKIHASIDMLISRNHIYRTSRGIWLDWMAQGTRVTRNLLHDNGPSDDLFVEVNHGPFLVDNNVFLSKTSVRDWSEGGAYVHNLFAGEIVRLPVLGRATPFHSAHTTEVLGIKNIVGGDNRFVNNIFVGPSGLGAYDDAELEVFGVGNVYLGGSAAFGGEEDAVVEPEFDSGLRVTENEDGFFLEIMLERAWSGAGLVTTETLGEAMIPGLPFVQPDGRPYRIETDYFGRDRDSEGPFPGPFEVLAGGRQTLWVWPNS